MIFADKEYRVNVAGARSLVYPANSLSLGDNVLMTAIFQAVLSDNLDESVTFVHFSDDIIKLVKRVRPEKLFLRVDSTCLTDEDIYFLGDWTEVIKFKLHEEADGLRQVGIYPDYYILKTKQFTEDDFSVDISKLKKQPFWFRNYVVFHIRNVKMIPGKNTDPELAGKILKCLISRKRIDSIVLIGNDDNYESLTELLQCERVVDLRKKLTLGEVFKVIRDSRLFIGSDSGIAHLAGCSYVPMVCWGFQNHYWFPKVRQRLDVRFYTKEDSQDDWILKVIKDMVREKIENWDNGL